MIHSRDIICLEFTFKRNVAQGLGESELVRVRMAVNASE